MSSRDQDRLPDGLSSSDEDGLSDSEVDQRKGTNEGRRADQKDSDEEELELLVLGNKAGFRANLFKPDDTLDDEDILEDLKLEDAHLNKDTGLEDIDDSALFFLDTAPQATADTQIAKVQTAVADQSGDASAPVWVDSDDERLSVSLANASRLRKLRETEADDVVSGAEYARRLRLQYLRLNPLPAWARESEKRQTKRRRRSSASSASSLDSDGASGDEADDVSALPLERFLRDASQLNGPGSRKKRKLRPEVIDIQRTHGIPDKHQGPVQSLAFHPEYPVVLSASTSSVLFLHHISPTAHPTPNPQLTSVQVKHTPVRRAEFHPNGDDIIFAGRRRYFHSWDISSGAVKKITQIYGHRLEQKSMERFRLSPCGRYMALIATSRKGGGMLNILNVKTMQWISQARLDSRGGIADFAWWGDGEGVTILGRDGQVAEWSMDLKRTVGLWRDEGSVGGTVIALGAPGGPASLGGDRFVSVGSNSGIMNVYDRNNLTVSSKDGGLELKENPEPLRRFDQLTTPITVVAFAPDGQVLGFGSQHKKDAFRLVHLPSCTVYRNWPTEQTPLGRITAVAFGMQSDLLAVGNDTGKIRMWEIRH